MTAEDARRVLEGRGAAHEKPLSSLPPVEQDAAQPTVAEVLDGVASRSGTATATSVQALRDTRAERDGQLADRSAP